MYNNILVPVALETEHDTNVDTAFAAARALASAGANITVLHVMEALPAYAISKIPGDLLAVTQKRLSHSLTETAKELPGAKAQLISGHSGRSILEYSEENNIDCIVVASHQPGLKDYFLGSTAARIVQYAKCAVHVVR